MKTDGTFLTIAQASEKWYAYKNGEFIMKRKLICAMTIICSALLAFTSCGSSSNASNAQAKKSKTVVYLLTTETPEYRDVAAFAITGGEKSGMASYTVDRYQDTTQSLMVMDFGTYQIIENQFTFITKNYTLVGTIADNKIIIDNKEYVKTEDAQ